jgi:hypothetical protein
MAADQRISSFNFGNIGVPHPVQRSAKTIGFGSHHTSDRVPAFDSRPGSVRNKWCGQTRILIFARATGRATVHDIRQAFISFLVDPRIKEAELWFALR